MAMEDFNLEGMQKETSFVSCENTDISTISVKEEMLSDVSSELNERTPENMNKALPPHSREGGQKCSNDSGNPFYFVGIKMEMPDDYESDASFSNSVKNDSMEEYPKNPEKDCNEDDAGLHDKSNMILSNPCCIDIKMECEEDEDNSKSVFQTHEDTSVPVDMHSNLDSNSILPKYVMGHSSNEFIRGIECQEFPILCVKQEEEKTDKLLAENRSKREYQQKYWKQHKKEVNWERRQHYIEQVQDDYTLKKGRDRQKRYRMLNREELRKRALERSDQTDNLPTAHLDLDSIEQAPDNEYSNQQAQDDDALKKKRERQKRYRELHREELRKKDAERWKRTVERELDENALKRKRERQKRYCELHREELRKRASERRKRTVNLPSARLDLDSIEQAPVNEHFNQQVQDDNALKRKRDRQKRYRELHREELRKRDSERWKRTVKQGQDDDALKRKRDRQKRYRELHREELRNRALERRKQTVILPTAHLDLDSIEQAPDNEHSNQQVQDNVALKKKRERQKRYRELHREELRKRDSERRKRTLNLPTAHVDFDSIEEASDNEHSIQQVQDDDALKKKRDRQKRYRELHREELRKRDSERRKQTVNLPTAHIDFDSIEEAPDNENSIQQ